MRYIVICHRGKRVYEEFRDETTARLYMHDMERSGFLCSIWFATKIGGDHGQENSKGRV
jgi:hypothetical protein